MKKLYLFCDASANQQQGIGVGCYLFLNQDEIDNFPSGNIKTKVQDIQIPSTSEQLSSQAEQVQDSIDFFNYFRNSNLASCTDLYTFFSL